MGTTRNKFNLSALCQSFLQRAGFSHLSQDQKEKITILRQSFLQKCTERLSICDNFYYTVMGFDIIILKPISNHLFHHSNYVVYLPMTP